ncbi:polysaccharide pyruvyl transferase family protein [Thermococcus sp. CX2]|uniref:polysaccharide pyruvyl transferase family protein n=1 Tax=Thermococcus sp. CX2 TaxID=163006 RepID=UPI00143AA622|nr:polysaccharide pyruvyl transferase family protein [Thermococcus sp. CX2]NJE86002.1 polysaccharide pyruvyl transferase family protein [Thermococcus sp. CX2]
MKVRILLLRTWLLNIGNGFIEEGAKACIKKAIPQAEIIEVSGYPDHVGYYLSLKTREMLKTTLKSGLLYKSNILQAKRHTINIVELMDIQDFDLAVLPGCVMDINLIKYYPTLKTLTDNGIPLVIVGGGGNGYSLEVVKPVRNILRKIKLYGFMSRDSIAYKLYAPFAKYSYNGIDCGFFVSDYYTPPHSRKKFVVFTFDSSSEPEIPTKYPIIRAYHEPFYLASLSHPILRASQTTLSKILHLHPAKILKKSNVLVSDNIKDYLFLYANAMEVHSDRVHACVAALSYGRKAKLYSSTPRAALFNRVLDKDITKEIVRVDIDRLNYEKQKLIEEFRKITEELI